MHQEVLDDPKFLEAADEHFVLCTIDFRKETPQKEVKFKMTLSRRLGYQRMPEIILTDSDLQVLGKKSGYEKSTPKKYLDDLVGLALKKR